SSDLIEGKIKAARYARVINIPFLGICLGMQTAVIEFARGVCKMDDANSSEFNKMTEFPVINLIEEQKNIKDKGATMRLGAYKCKIQQKTKAYNAYKNEVISERHRHRYEFNNTFMEELKKKGMIFSGINPERELVEIVELKKHPWYVACQFHPEFKSKPDKAHPLFADFISAALKVSSGKKKK
ncbi:MAG: gamma-glutamyl-gamma-aminobutyrate hydrolase family protein, partial [Candidatus Omnitrophica bacterium]|nr:gamma-glutamyl-gamma-aminobutyrate hydrolase family protein [Candidatus Omnitrophota bacterium]